jgi:predicted amidohydrolase YtcJ
MEGGKTLRPSERDPNGLISERQTDTLNESVMKNSQTEMKFADQYLLNVVNSEHR